MADTSGHPSWTDGGAGKLRRSTGDLPVRGFLQLRQPLGDTLSLVAAGEFTSDGTSRENGPTQLYLSWRPVPRSRLRHRLTVGAFYPRISLEHSQAGWTSSYSINPSAIGTWVGEELRTVGAEWRMSTRVQALGTNGVLSISPSVFVGNDPTGALLAWRGWSIHDRQSTLFDRLPLPNLPVFGSAEGFEEQASRHAPFTEVDGRVGVSVAVDYKRSARSFWRAGYYDNRANPVALDDGQYGWHTAFHHIGVRQALVGNFELLAQWMRGTTEMGQPLGARAKVDAVFASHFIQLAYLGPRQVVTLRLDRFRVDDRDVLTIDDSNERGHAFTFGYRWQFTPRLRVAAEWLRIRTERPVWGAIGLAPQRTETQLQLRLQFRG